MPKAKKTTAAVDTAATKGKAAHLEAFEVGKRNRETIGPANGADTVNCPYLALAPMTKTAFHRDCYFAGLNGEPLPKTPDWYATAAG